MACKYKFPCNWCEKFNKQCTEITKECQTTSTQQECDHDWVFDLTYIVNSGKTPVYKQIATCRKCGLTKTADASYMSY